MLLLVDIVVFDDVQCYDHTKVDQLMYDNNFDVVENTDFKISSMIALDNAPDFFL